MIDFFRDLFGRWTPYVILGVLGIIFALMLIFGLNFG